MTVDYCDPDGDISITWVATGTPHADQIDDAVRQPAGDPGSDDFIEALDGYENLIDHFSMDNSIQGVDIITTIEIWCYGRCGLGGDEDASIDIYLGSWQGYKTLPFTTSKGWHSVSWIELSGSQAQLNALEVRIKAYSNYAQYDYTDIYCMYAKVTYSEAVVGYGHDYMGIPAANIDNVNGIPSANIDNIKGV